MNGFYSQGFSFGIQHFHEPQRDWLGDGMELGRAGGGVRGGEKFVIRVCCVFFSFGCGQGGEAMRLIAAGYASLKLRNSKWLLMLFQIFL